MTVRLVNDVTMSSIQKTKNEDIDEAIIVLEEETQRRIEDLQQRIEFVCASLRAQGNTEINKMLMSVRELSVEEFCETYDANTQKFLKQQAQQRRQNNNDLKSSVSLNNEVDAVPKKKAKLDASVKMEVDLKTSTTTKDDTNNHSKIPEKDVLVPQTPIADPLSQQHVIEKAQPQRQEPPRKTEPVIISIERQGHASIAIELNTQSIQPQGNFSVKSSLEQPSELEEAQKSLIRQQIEDLQEQLELFKKSIV